MLVAGQHDVDQERMAGDMPDRESDVGEGVYFLVHDWVIPFRFKKNSEHRACDAPANDDDFGLRS